MDKMDEFTFTVMKTDVVNGRNRLYPKEVVQQAIQTAKDHKTMLMVLPGSGTPQQQDVLGAGGVDLTKVIGTVRNIQMNEMGEVLCTIRFIDAGMGPTFETLVRSNPDAWSCRTFGFGKISQDGDVGTVTEYTVEGLSIDYKNKFAPLEKGNTMNSASGINLCQISPTAHLEELCSYNNVHLILAHLVETDEQYTEWYANRFEMKILDNSAFEMYKQGREMYPADQLLEMGKRVNADVIVMSDYPNEKAQRTIDAAERLGPIFHENGFKTFFVPQSEIGDMDDYLRSFEYAIESPNVDFIGVSILGVPNAFGNIEKDNKLQRFLSRWKLMGMLKENGMLDRAIRNGKKIHFLGALDGWPGEIELVRDFHQYIFSWDSSQCVWHGLNGIMFDDSPTGLINGKFEEEVDFSHVADTVRVDLAKANIEMLLETV